MLAFHFNTEDLRTAALQNWGRTWDFIVDEKEQQFYATGTWEEARAKAEAHARTSYGCRDGRDSVLVVRFVPDDPQITEQHVNPGKGINKDGDDILRDPENADPCPMEDLREKLL
jgi:hypothetical protein